MSKGGEVIQKIQAETNTIINIEEEGELSAEPTPRHGIVDVASQNKDDIAAALKWIKDICTVPEVGDIFNAKVVSIVEFGAFMEFLPSKEGLMHISEYEWGHPATLEGLIKEGDELLTPINLIQRCSQAYHLPGKAGYHPSESRHLLHTATATVR